jgi:hypothetical protein
VVQSAWRGRYGVAPHDFSLGDQDSELSAIPLGKLKAHSIGQDKLSLSCHVVQVQRPNVFYMQVALFPYERAFSTDVSHPRSLPSCIATHGTRNRSSTSHRYVSSKIVLNFHSKWPFRRWFSGSIGTWPSKEAD